MNEVEGSLYTEKLNTFEVKYYYSSIEQDTNTNTALLQKHHIQLFTGWHACTDGTPIILDYTIRTRYTASLVGFHKRLHRFGVITAHNTDFHYKDRRPLSVDYHSRRFYEWHPLDIFQLVHKQKIQSVKKFTGHIKLSDFAFIAPSHLIINYKFQPLSNQFIFNSPKVLITIIDHLHESVLIQEKKIAKLEAQLQLVTLKLQV